MGSDDNNHLLPVSVLYPARRRSWAQRMLLGTLCPLAVCSTMYLSAEVLNSRDTVVLPLDAQSTLAKCRSMQLKPAPPADFYSRAQSDRYQPGTKPVLIRNATVWTGNLNGTEVVRGDVLLDKGIIKAVGGISEGTRLQYADATTIDANG